MDGTFDTDEPEIRRQAQPFVRLPAFYERDGITIYNADCLEVLPTLPRTIDAVITDPPYSSGGAFRSDRTAPTAAKYLGSHGDGPGVELDYSGDSRDSRGWLFWSSLWMLRCHAICNESALAMIFTDWRQLPQCSDLFQASNWVWRGLAVWDKGNARPMSGRFSHQAEFILWGSKGAIGWDYEKPCGSGVMQFPAPKTFHQAEKPVGLIAQMLQLTPEGGLILDPFMGSGTTLVAAKANGRRAIGIEISEKNCEIAVTRLRQGVLFGGMEATN